MSASPAAFVTRAEVNAFMQLQLKQNSPKLPPTTSYSGITCFNCGQPGHMKQDCTVPPTATPGPKNPQGWKTIAPTQSASTTKSMNGKTYHWCAHCKTWRLSHGTNTHKDPETLNQERALKVTEPPQVMLAKAETLETLEWTTEGAWDT
jgi:Zinc knuckle